MSTHKNNNLFTWLLTIILTILLSVTLNSICLSTTVFSVHFTSDVLTEPYNAKIITDGINQQIDNIQDKYPLPIKLPQEMFQTNEIKPIIQTTIHRLYNGNPAIFSAQQILETFLLRLQKLTKINIDNSNLSIIFAKAQKYVLHVISKQLNTPLIQEEVTTFSNACARLHMILVGSILFSLLFFMLMVLQHRQQILYYLGISLIGAAIISVGSLWHITSQLIKIKLPLNVKIIHSFYSQVICHNSYLLIITFIMGIILLLIDYYHRCKS